MYYLFQIDGNLGYFDPNNGILRWKKLKVGISSKGKHFSSTATTMQQIERIIVGTTSSNPNGRQKLTELRNLRMNVPSDMMQSSARNYEIDRQDLAQLIQHSSIRFGIQLDSQSLGGLKVVLACGGIASFLDILSLIIHGKSLLVVSDNPLDVI